MLVNNTMFSDFKEERTQRNLKVQKKYDQFLYKAYRDKGDVTFEELEAVEVGREYEFPSINGYGIQYTRKHTFDNNILKYEMTFSKGSVIARHIHSDCYEQLEVCSENSPSDNVFLVITGSERAGNFKQTILSVGDIFIVPKGVEHQVSNATKSSARLIIKFIKD